MTLCKGLWCIFFRLTTYNVIFVVGILVARQIRNVPNFFIDIVRAISLGIIISVLYIHVIYDPNIVIDIYKRIFPIDLPTEIYYICDIIVHILPVIIFGLPQNFMSVIIGLLIIWIWYGSLYSHIQYLYSPNISMKDYNHLIIVYMPIMMLAIYLCSHFNLSFSF